MRALHKSQATLQCKKFMSKFLYSKRSQIRDNNNHVPETQQHLSERSTISNDTPERLLALEPIDLAACKQSTERNSHSFWDRERKIKSP